MKEKERYAVLYRKGFFMKKNWKKDASRGPHKSSSLIWVLAFPFYFLHKIIPHRPLVILCFVSVALMLAVTILTWFILREWIRDALFGLMLVTFVAAVNLMLTANYTFAGSNTAILIASAFLGILAGTFFTIWCFHHKYKILPLIGLSLGFSIFFTCCFIFSAFHLNYLFDTHPPVECEAVIEDKDVDRNRKGPDDYELIVTIEGKRITMDVSSEEYRRYDIGDTYTFYRYQGAFNIPFYFEE